MEYKQLMGVILSRPNMLMAYRRVLRNGGAAGVDGVSVKELAEYLREHWPRVRTELLSGTYRPALVRGVEIPKASGGKRLLGIPTVLDRLIQQAIHQVLSPLWEPDFSPYSFGFRPLRSAAHALAQATEYINEGYQYIIDLDLKSFFDRVNHDKLMGIVGKKIKDVPLLRLIRRYLQTGIIGGLYECALLRWLLRVGFAAHFRKAFDGRLFIRLAFNDLVHFFNRQTCQITNFFGI